MDPLSLITGLLGKPPTERLAYDRTTRLPMLQRKDAGFLRGYYSPHESLADNTGWIPPIKSLSDIRGINDILKNDKPGIVHADFLDNKDSMLEHELTHGLLNQAERRGDIPLKIIEKLGPLASPELKEMLGRLYKHADKRGIGSEVAARQVTLEDQMPHDAYAALMTYLLSGKNKEQSAVATQLGSLRQRSLRNRQKQGIK